MAGLGTGRWSDRGHAGVHVVRPELFTGHLSGGDAVRTPGAYSPVPGDLAADDIERRIELAVWDLRHGGDGELARRGVPRRRRPIRTRQVYAVIAAGDTTIQGIAERLQCESTMAWGHVSFLRKQRKVEVKRWQTSPRGRRVAVYGVIRDV